MGRVSGAITQQSRFTSSAIATSSNDTTAIENAFEELTERIPRLYSIIDTVDPTKIEKVNECRKCLDTDLACINSSSKESKYFFITCSLTSWLIFLEELSDSVKDSSIEGKNQNENMEFIDETRGQFASIVIMHTNNRTRISKNPYRTVKPENASEASEKDNAQSESESSKTVIAEDAHKELELQENSVSGGEVEAFKNPSLQDKSSASVIVSNKDQAITSSAKSSETGQDETCELHQTSTKRRKRNRRRKNKKTEQIEETNVSIARENGDHSETPSVQQFDVNEKNSCEQIQNTSGQRKRRNRKRNKPAQRQEEINGALSAENNGQSGLLSTYSPELPP
nr:hypothetical protein HmN_000636200 [Hymenolepis microstoma]